MTRLRFVAPFFALVPFACSSSGGDDGPPASPPLAADASTSTPPDGGSTPPLATCGNGKRDEGELCDGDEVDCGSLSGLYGAGAKAVCRPTCGGYDVSKCSFPTDRQEVVQPAAREPALWANAQCNKDGAFPLFVRKRDPKRWVIRLEGGGACSPAGGAPCYQRAASLVSPVVGGKPVVDRATSEAANMENVPADFAEASYAILNYCSSDAWTGTQDSPIRIPADATGTTTMEWRFSGRANVRAALQILAQRYGLDDDDAATKVFFQGGSAGGHGVLHNVDQLKIALPKSAARKQLWAFANAASYFEGWRGGDATVDGDFSALDATGAHTGAYWEDALPAVIASWRGDMGNGPCVAAFPGEPHKCFFLSNLQPFVVDPAPKGLGVPLAIAQNLEDPSPQDEFGIVQRGTPRAFAPGGEAASKAWGDVHKQRAQSLRWAYMVRDPLGLHGVPLRTRGATTPTLQSLLDGFVSKGDPDPFSYIDFAVAN